LAGWAVLLVQSTMNYSNQKLAEILGKYSIRENHALFLSDIPVDMPVFPYQLGGILSLSQGFLLVSMLWSAITVHIIERNFLKAFYWSVAAAILSFMGIIHSWSLRGNDIINNYSLPASMEFTVAYLLFSLLFLFPHFFQGERP